MPLVSGNEEREIQCTISEKMNEDILDSLHLSGAYIPYLIPIIRCKYEFPRPRFSQFTMFAYVCAGHTVFVSSSFEMGQCDANYPVISVKYVGTINR